MLYNGCEWWLYNHSRWLLYNSYDPNYWDFIAWYLGSEISSRTSVKESFEPAPRLQRRASKLFSPLSRIDFLAKLDIPELAMAIENMGKSGKIDKHHLISLFSCLWSVTRGDYLCHKEHQRASCWIVRPSHRPQVPLWKKCSISTSTEMALGLLNLDIGISQLEVS